MIKPEQIPDEAWNAAYIAFVKSREQSSFLNLRELISEAINAWPGRSVITVVSAADAFGNHHPVHPMTLHLPLPQEKNDD